MPPFPKIKLKDSISARILVIVFSCYCVVSIGITAFQVIVEYSDAKANILEEMKNLSGIFERGASRAILNGDTEQIQSTVVGIVESPNIVGIAVHIPLLNQTIFYGIHPSPEEEEDLLFQYQALIHHEESEENASKITLYSSEEVVFNQIKDKLLIIILNAAVKTLALWIIFLWINRLLLNRPLLDLIHATQTLDLNNLNNTKIDIAVTGKNELALLEDSFNNMIQKIHFSQKELKYQKKQLEKEVYLQTLELQKANQQMQEDLALAAELQNSILSKIPDLPFLKTSYRYFSYDLVSGDVYDMSLNREKEFCFFLGDATGHGIAAAFMTMMVEIGLDSIPDYLPSDEILRRLNGLLASRETGKSITGIYLRISAEGHLYTSNAGHPPLLIIPSNGSGLVSLNEAGCPLGMFAEEMVPFVEEQYQLQDGNKVFVYTDGLVEWENAEGEQFGYKRLEKFLVENRFLHMDQLLENLTLYLKEFAQVPPKDDTTFYCFEFKKS